MFRSCNVLCYVVSSTCSNAEISGTQRTPCMVFSLPWRLYEVPAARILLLESLFSFIFGCHHTYKLYKNILVKSASKLPERTTSVKFRSHAITTGTPNAFRRRVLIGCYRLVNAETTNHAQPLIERVPKSHGGLVLTPVVLILLLSLFRSRFDFIIFFLPGVAQICIFTEKYVRPYFTLIPVRNTGKTY